MNYHNITKDDMLNGDGLRVVLWVSGCNHQCEDCQNPVTWDLTGGLPFDEKAEDELFEALAPDYISGITFSGGDPLHPFNREEVLRLKDELKESYDNNKLSEQDIEQYKSLLSIKDIELLNLDEQNQKLQAQISILKDIKLNSMEEKLNKTIDMLNNMQDYLVENRIIARRTSKLIDGRDITDEELAAERLKLEAIKNGK